MHMHTNSDTTSSPNTTGHPSALLRPADLRQCLPFKSLTSVWSLVKTGELPEPIRIGGRAVAWHAHEIDAILAARAAGASIQEIRTLVADIHAARQTAWQRVRESIRSAVGVAA